MDKRANKEIDNETDKGTGRGAENGTYMQTDRQTGADRQTNGANEAVTEYDCRGLACCQSVVICDDD